MEAAGRRAGKPERTRRNEDYLMDGGRRMTHEDEGLRLMNEGIRRLDEGGMKRMNEGEYSNERLEKRCLAMFCILSFYFYLFLLLNFRTHVMSWSSTFFILVFFFLDFFFYLFRLDQGYIFPSHLVKMR